MKKFFKIFLLVILSLVVIGCTTTPSDNKPKMEIKYDSEIVYTQSSLLKVSSNVENDTFIVKSTRPSVVSVEQVSNTEYKLTANALGSVKIIVENSGGLHEEIAIKVIENEQFSAINDFEIFLEEEGPYYMGETYHLVINPLPSNYIDEYEIIKSDDYTLNLETREIMFKHTGTSKISVYAEQKALRYNQTFDIEINPDVECYEILYLGNSLTYVHDIPSIIKNMIMADGAYISYIQITEGGASLLDHEFKFNEAVNKYDFTHIILQEQSYGPIASFSKFKEACLKYVNTLKELNSQAEVILYETWAYNEPVYNRIEKYEMTRLLQVGYEEVAQLINSRITRAGEAFKLYEQSGDYPSLYQDLNHQSEYGAYLSACVHYSTLTGRKASTNTFVYDQIDLETQKIIQGIADRISFSE